MTAERDDARPVVVYATFPDYGTADAIATALVEQRLAACVNLIPGMRSIYRWQGALERADEVVAIIKSQAAEVPRIVATIERLHPYHAPAVVVLPIESGSRAYLDWITAETTGG